MDDRALYSSLSAYLDRAIAILGAWSTWLTEHEQLILSAEVQDLVQHTLAADALTTELTLLSESRTKLLAEAHATGTKCSTLKQLAESLPQYRMDRSFRSRVRAVEQSMSHLRRLNIAAWLLVHQCAKHVDETLLLMTSGSAERSVYVAAPHADTMGGQILDSEV